jgi:hypothetical protein
MNFTPSRLDNPAQNVLLWAAWQRAEREQHDTESLLAVVLPDLAPSERAIHFERIGARLDLAEQAEEANDDRTLADTYLDDAQQVIRYLLTRQADAAEDKAMALVNGPAISLVR